MLFILAVTTLLTHLPVVPYTNLPGYLSLASSYTQIGQPDKAIPILREILSGSDHAGARHMLGMALLAVNRPNEAVIEFEHSDRDWSPENLRQF